MRKPKSFSKNKKTSLGSLNQAFNLKGGKKAVAPMPKEHHCKLVFKEAYNLYGTGPKE